MKICDWPTAERPREKLLKYGPASLSDAELLAIFFRSGTKGKNAVELAREALNEFKTIHNLLGAAENEILAIRGLGTVKFTLLQAALELGRRYLEEELFTEQPLTSALHAKKYVIAKLAGYQHEVFACIFLNSGNRVIKYEDLFQGTINFAPIYPRIVAQKALQYNAAGVILAHNHPSGSLEPSQSDIDCTKNLIQILKYLDIRVLDHLIVGANQCRSMAEEGYI